MNTQRLTSAYADLTHGWHGVILFYVLIAAFSLLGLKRGRAGVRHYLFWPITSLFTLVGIAPILGTLHWLLEKLGLPLLGMAQALSTAILTMFGGFLGGMFWAEYNKPLKATHGRGAVVFDGP